MDGNIRLNATVISCVGKNSSKDDFYFNGNITNCYNTESVQCSFDKTSNSFVFAVSDSIGIDNSGIESISAIREIKRCHESAKMQYFSLENIAEKIYEAVQLSSNLVYSKSIVSNMNSATLTGFSSLIIDNNRAVIMNLGNNGVFLFRNGEQREIFSKNVDRRTQKLRTLGISTNNTTDFFNDTQKVLKLAEEDSKTRIKISTAFEIMDGDVIVLCSDGLMNNINKNRIEAVVDSGFDSSKMTSVLFQEAAKNSIKSGIDDDITIMAIKVDEIKNIPHAAANPRRQSAVSYDNEPEVENDGPGGENKLVNYVLTAVCAVVICGVLFMGYTIFSNSLSLKNKEPTKTTQASTPSKNETNADNSAAQDSSSEKTDLNNADTSNGDSGTQKDNTSSNQNTEYDIHVVKPGETLSTISNKYYGDPNKYNIIIKYNNLKNENSVFAGQKLKIPKLK